MWDLITTGGTYLFLGGRALKLIKTRVNVTNSTNSLSLTKNITLTIIDHCTPLPIRIAPAALIGVFY